MMRKFIVLISLAAAAMGSRSMAEEMMKRHITVSSGYGNAPYAAKASLTEREAFNSAVLGSLVTLEDSYVLKPKLLSSWYWDFKTSEYVLKVDPAARFHDGVQLSAAHVEFGIKRWAGVKDGNILAHYLKDIEGIDEVESTDLPKPGSVKGMRVIDDHTLRIRLKKPNTGFMYWLSYTAFAPVRPETLQDDLITWKEIPVGCGDFKVESIDSENKRITLSRFAHSGEGNLTGLTFNYSEKSWSDSDLMIWLHDYTPEGFEKHTLKSYSNTVDLGYMFDFNFNEKIVNEVKFRQAVDLAIDREAIAQVYQDAVPLYRLLPSNFWGISASQKVFDPEKAKRLIDSIKGILPKRPIRIRMRNRESEPLHKKISAILAKNFEAIGLATEFITTIPKDRDVWLEKGHDLRFMWLGVGDILDPLSQYSLYLPGTPYSDMKVPQDSYLEDSFDRASASPSFDVRVEETRKLSDYFQSKSYAIPVYGKRASVWTRNGIDLDLGSQRSSLMFYLDRVSIAK